MDKRTFLKFGAAFTASSFVSGLITSCNSAAKATVPAPAAAAKMPAQPTAIIPAPTFELPPLPYGTSALEPMIDAKTMEIHHGKHHAAYVKNLNAALTGKMVSAPTLEGILKNVTAEEAAIRNHGGGHYNHMLYWRTLQPGGAPNPKGTELGKAIDAQFGNFEALHEKLVKASTGVFGSGWAWLAIGADKKLFVSITPNQDNPLMANLVKDAGIPILGIDVWEHAYYLKHQNKRADYVTNFMQLVNWDVVNAEYTKV
jgi:superoxide dismutase, Fe-Mn family